ncbi:MULTISPECIES: hypothetical protein [unclassified Paenibacillus]|uniref:hypothetical protein n=1 Tax=unclassified Paenibacillus TaxID=185978 RepID=UPI001C0FEC1E|nr:MULTISPECIES: hypothetical protein [unclassified Paenibacillus]MBU5444164.1 hypothetical protein [Paenibacillus sp. MSJ-34]CAH0122699.1 hypothetical protein PAE9249_05285 [Paenibacillus sp. CECT 9249]
MSPEHDSNVTIYRYKLIHKINYSKTLLLFYILLLPILCSLPVFLFGWLSLFYVALAFAVVSWLHYVIIRSVLLIASEPIKKRWRHRIRFPWIGYLPEQYISYSVFVRIHKHVLWIGLCCIVVLLPWSPPAFTAGMAIWHLWLAIPRLVCFYRLRRQPKYGMIKLNDTDLSYYRQ